MATYALSVVDGPAEALPHEASASPSAAVPTQNPCPPKASGHHFVPLLDVVRDVALEVDVVAFVALTVIDLELGSSGASKRYLTPVSLSQ